MSACVSVCLPVCLSLCLSPCLWHCRPACPAPAESEDRVALCCAQCSAKTCKEEGLQNRLVYCRLGPTDILPNSNCDMRQRPADTRQCSAPCSSPSTTHRWKSGPWSSVRNAWPRAGRGPAPTAPPPTRNSHPRSSPDPGLPVRPPTPSVRGQDTASSNSHTRVSSGDHYRTNQYPESSRRSYHSRVGGPGRRRWREFAWYDNYRSARAQYQQERARPTVAHGRRTPGPPQPGQQHGRAAAPPAKAPNNMHIFSRQRHGNSHAHNTHLAPSLSLIHI